MIETDVFGCSAKLPFAETEALAAAGDGGDFSILRCDGEIATSIDRVHRCARDWGRFARIALNHAFGDVVCAGSAPLQVMLSFEFGVRSEENTSELKSLMRISYAVFCLKKKKRQK